MKGKLTAVSRSLPAVGYQGEFSRKERKRKLFKNIEKKKEFVDFSEADSPPLV